MALNVLIYDRRVLVNVARLGATKADLITSGISQKKSFNTSNKTASDNSLSKLLTTHKRGTGGRSSVSGGVVTVFGSSGQMGRTLLNRLGKEGYTVVAPYRGDDYFVRNLKLCGDLGQIHLFPFDLKDDTSIRQAVEKSDIVVNCIGRDWETSNFTYEDIYVDGPKRIAKIARESGVQKLVHFSSLNASSDPQRIGYVRGGSKYLKAKYEGESAVRSEYPEAVIIRPSVMYGEGDRFLMYYKGFFRRTPLTIPLWKRGEKTIKIPVHYSDAATGTMKIITDPTISGRTYDFVGPDRYLLSELVDYMMKVLRRPELIRTNMGPYFLLLNLLYEQFPKRKLYNFDALEREFISDVVTPENYQLKDLGVECRKFEDVVPWHLGIYSRTAFYDEALGEIPLPDAPKPLNDDFYFKQI